MLDGINVMSPDGSEQTNITQTATELCYSPDGERIAFSSGGGSAEIYLMNSDGTDPIRLTYNDWSDPFSRARFPSWSPDGNNIVFARGRRAGHMEEDITPRRPEIYTINIYDKSLKRLTDDNNINTEPAWSPFLE